VIKEFPLPTVTPTYTSTSTFTITPTETPTPTLTYTQTPTSTLSPTPFINPIINGGFENGSSGWTQYSTNGYTLIMNSGFPSGVKPHNGSWAVWLGGEYDAATYIQQQVTIPVGAPYLVYYQWLQSEDICDYDLAGVLINDNAVDAYDLCYIQNTYGWVKHSVNLSAYIGQSVKLQIGVVTDDILNSNLFVDDVSLQASPSGSEQIYNKTSKPGDLINHSKVGFLLPSEKVQMFDNNELTILRIREQFQMLNNR